MVSWRLRSEAEINNHQTLSTSFTVETVVMEFSPSHFFSIDHSRNIRVMEQ